MAIDTRSRSADLSRRAALVAVGVTAAALGVVALVALPGAPTDSLPPGGDVAAVLIVLLGWGFVAIGAAASLRRPDNRTGALLAAVGILALASSLFVLDNPVASVVAEVTDPLSLAVFIHLLLAFPSGRLETRAARVVAGGIYAALAGGGLAVLLLGGDPSEFGCAGCPDNPVAIADSETAIDVIAWISTIVAIALVAATAVILVGRWRAAGRFARRAFAPPILVGALILLFAVVWGIVQAIGVSPGAQEAVQIVYISSFALLPAAFLAGLWRGRFFRAATVSRIVERVAYDPPSGGLAGALRAALGDPSLTVAYWLPERGAYVDRDGRAVVLPPAGAVAAVTPVDHRGRHVGALVHDAALLDDPELLRATAGAVGLALENGRLEAELRARLEALRSSRARLVEAGDAERRRLGRDLHDGAQQRLVSLLIELQLARERWSTDPEAARALVDSAFENAGAAVDELRDLAAGIHPAILSQRGLDAAVESLATRSPVPVELESRLAERLPSAVETAAYFVVAEALTNVAKYARASHARVGVRLEDGAAVVEVRDDGVGGADGATGSGLRGLGDRVGALDGTIELVSPPGEGTLVRARIPIGG